jgi:hypothetical protein
MNRVFKRLFLTDAGRGRLLKQFAKKLGLVYFGRVDQHQDEHDVIRGLTVSTSHKDNHYAVGAHDGYDISIVDRSDIVTMPNGTKSQHNWFIIRFNLVTPEELPHLFLNPLGHTQEAYAKFFQAFHHLQPVNAIMLGGHTPEFHGRYALYTMSSRALEVEEYLPPEVTQVIANRLWPHAVELFENKLYIYSTEEKLSAAVLNTALESGLWLARIFDKRQD